MGDIFGSPILTNVLLIIVIYVLVLINSDLTRLTNKNWYEETTTDSTNAS